MELNICHLYPDVMSLYGDRGNVMCMKKRLEWRGIDANIDEIPIGEAFNREKYDLIFIGAGQELEQEALLRDFRGEKEAALKAAVEEGKVILAISSGFHLLGKYYEDAEGKRTEYSGAVDMWTVAGKKRVIGDTVFKCFDEDGGFTVAAFENHLGKTYFGEGVRPFGKMIVGKGNNGEDGFEGARYKNVFATYSHGPLLPKNPELCDMLLTLALKERYPDAVLSPLEDNFEHKARDYMKERLDAK